MLSESVTSFTLMGYAGVAIRLYWHERWWLKSFLLKTALRELLREIYLLQKWPRPCLSGNKKMRLDQVGLGAISK